MVLLCFVLIGPDTTSSPQKLFTMPRSPHREDGRSTSRSSSQTAHSEKPRKSRNIFRKDRSQKKSDDALVKSIQKFRFIPALVQKSHEQLQQVARTLIKLHDAYDPDNQKTAIGKDIRKMVEMVKNAEKLHCGVQDNLEKEAVYQQALAEIPRRPQNELILEDLEYFRETGTSIQKILKRYRKSEIMKLHQGDERRIAASEFIRCLEDLNDANNALIGKVDGAYEIIGGEGRIMLPSELREYPPPARGPNLINTSERRHHRSDRTKMVIN
ncbi:hypothetical protein ACMFMG_001875 [Clarireedia jacksonii]